MENDLSDGLVFKNLVEKLTDGVVDIQMPMGELVHSEERQRRNLSEVVSKIEEITGVDKYKRKWSANAIFDKNLLSIIFFLLHIVEHFVNEGKIQYWIHLTLYLGKILKKIGNFCGDEFH